jgi:hypothetical protein
MARRRANGPTAGADTTEPERLRRGRRSEEVAAHGGPARMSTVVEEETAGAEVALEGA